MERWKIVFAFEYKSDALSGPRKAAAILPEQTDKIIAKADRELDVVYKCKHRLVGYRLRGDEWGFYYLPNPVCVECKTVMNVARKFGEGAKG